MFVEFWLERGHTAAYNLFHCVRNETQYKSLNARFNYWYGMVASGLVRSSPEEVVWVQALAEDIVLCS